MSIALNSAATNNADWDEIWEFKASYDGGASFDLIDFTGVSIDVQIRDVENCLRIQATTDNGKITIVDVGRFEITVPESEMKNLCAGSYSIGGRFIASGATVSLFTGSLSIIDGVAK